MLSSFFNNNVLSKALLSAELEAVLERNVQVAVKDNNKIVPPFCLCLCNTAQEGIPTNLEGVVANTAGISGYSNNKIVAINKLKKGVEIVAEFGRGESISFNAVGLTIPQDLNYNNINNKKNYDGIIGVVLNKKEQFETIGNPRKYVFISNLIESEGVVYFVVNRSLTSTGDNNGVVEIYKISDNDLILLKEIKIETDNSNPQNSVRCNKYIHVEIGGSALCWYSWRSGALYKCIFNLESNEYVCSVDLNMQRFFGENVWKGVQDLYDVRIGVNNTLEVVKLATREKVVLNGFYNVDLQVRAGNHISVNRYMLKDGEVLDIDGSFNAKELVIVNKELKPKNLNRGVKVGEEWVGFVAREEGNGVVVDVDNGGVSLNAVAGFSKADPVLIRGAIKSCLAFCKLDRVITKQEGKKLRIVYTLYA